MTLNGIDVSHWQTSAASKSTAYDFLIAKATEGTGYTDPMCATHIGNALARGKPVGVYHFANAHKHPGTAGAVAEADYFLTKVAGWVGRAALILDWEADSVKAGASWAKAWCDRVTAKTGIRPWFYTYKAALTSAYSILTDHPLWIAAYGSNTSGGYRPATTPPTIAPWKTLTAFQYCSRGRLPGYNADLDLDVFYGTAATWAKLAGASQTAPPSSSALTVDGLWGTATTRRLQQVLGTTTDGIVSDQYAPYGAQCPGLTTGWDWRAKNGTGSNVIRAVQRRLNGVVVDGVLGTVTGKALMARFGYQGTGLFTPGSPTIKALQTRLNQGGF
ncbi:MAG: hypothetical protein FWG25_06535 [Promicromonosporaceae bacterium]|nr:hypothetical protein [Promicromonosporaceae bacterium]